MIPLKISNIPTYDYCVYRLLNANKVVIYVGQTSNLEARVGQHLYNGKEFCFLEAFACDKSEASQIEADEIIKHNPALNVLLPKTPKYKTLGQARMEISRDITKKKNTAINLYMSSINLVFERDKVKNMKFEYVLTEDLNKILSDISRDEFINQSPELIESK